MKLNAKRALLLTGVFCLILLVIGCATIMQGTNQGVGISSTPSGASVTIDNQSYGSTPIVAKLSRKDNHIVSIEMSGYQPFETTLTRKTSGWVWGNILFGGLIGLAVDAISGGLYKLTPEQVEAILNKGSMGVIDQADMIFVTVVLEPNYDWERIATLEPRGSE